MSHWPDTRTLLPHSDGAVSSSIPAGHILMMSVHVTPLRSSLAVLAEVSAGGGTWPPPVLVKIRSGNLH